MGATKPRLRDNVGESSKEWKAGHKNTLDACRNEVRPISNSKPPNRPPDPLASLARTHANLHNGVIGSKATSRSKPRQEWVRGGSG
eukprot:1705725-Pleurochrysis_carterae.AAC.2